MCVFCFVFEWALVDVTMLALALLATLDFVATSILACINRALAGDCAACCTAVLARFVARAGLVCCFYLTHGAYACASCCHPYRMPLCLPSFIHQVWPTTKPVLVVHAYLTVTAQRFCVCAGLPV